MTVGILEDHEGRKGRKSRNMYLDKPDHSYIAGRDVKI
jgi:hypothetical protein